MVTIYEYNFLCIHEQKKLLLDLVNIVVDGMVSMKMSERKVGKYLLDSRSGHQTKTKPFQATF